MLAHVRGERWLDAGAGEGRLSRELARRGAFVLGVDVAAPLVRAARRRAAAGPAAARSRQRFAVAGLAAPGLVARGSLDGVLASLSLMHVARIEPVLRAWSRALRPGGRLVLVLPHPCFMGPGTSWNARLPQVPRGDAVPIELAVRDYPLAGRQVFRFSADFPETTVNFHRSLESYQEALAAASFLTRRILEPRPPRALVARDPSWEPYARVPFFVVWEALKSAV